MKTAVYARISTKDGRQDVENQLRQLREYASTQQWTVVHEYIDHASGKMSDREQLNQMLNDASRRAFDLLLFWSLDRLSREGVVETLNYLERLSRYGVHYRSYTEQYLDSTGIFREAVIGILAAIAKQERIRISERTIAGLQRAREQGRIGGRPKAEEDRKLVSRVDALRTEGKSIRRIAAIAGISPSTVQKLVGRMVTGVVPESPINAGAIPETPDRNARLTPERLPVPTIAFASSQDLR